MMAVFVVTARREINNGVDSKLLLTQKKLVGPDIL